jgi:hypothetical protein
MDRFLSRFRGHQEPSVPLAFLTDDSYWEATIVRSAIVNAVGNIKATEAKCREDFRQGKQTSRQAAVRTQVHRNQVQTLAQLGNRHAQLCYNFEHAQLLVANINSHEDPTCRRALRGCFEEIDKLGLDPYEIQSHIQNSQVVPIILKWYSPAFTCTLHEFHSRIWYRSQLPSWEDAGVIIAPRAWES